MSDLSLAILTGGESTRMGARKIELTISGKLFVEHTRERLAPLFRETLIVGSAPLPGMSPAWRHVPDRFPIRTPLVGIYSAIAAAETSRCFVVACDMPWVSASLVDLMAGYTPEAEATVPMVNGFLEPLCAIYHKRATRTLEEALAEGVRKVTDGIRRLSFSTLPEDLLRTVDPDLRSFTNVNSPEDLDRLDALLLRQADRPS